MRARSPACYPLDLRIARRLRFCVTAFHAAPMTPSARPENRSDLSITRRMIGPDRGDSRVLLIAIARVRRMCCVFYIGETASVGSEEP
jgi:hypothetical protein